MKYENQDQRYKKGAWQGDGVPSKMSTKAARDARRYTRKQESKR